MMRVRSTSVNGYTDDGEDDLNVLFSAWRLSRAVGHLLDRELAASRLTADEFGVYSVLAGAPSITPTALARWMVAPQTTVSSYVKRLESRGHIERIATSGDRRSYQLRLSPAGRRAHRQAAALFAPVLARVQAALGPQEPDVQRVLRTLRTALSER